MNFSTNYYQNELSQIKMTSKEIEQCVYSNPMRFEHEKNGLIESCQLPYMVRPFYDYIKRNNKIPTFEEYYRLYVNNNQNFITSLGITMRELVKNEELNIGLKGRLNRTWLSLIRDVHFAKLCKEKSNGEFDVLYNRDLDSKNDVDVMIVLDGSYYAICLFVDTKRSNKYRKEKEHRHERFSNVEYIEHTIPMSRFDGKDNEVVLFNENDFETIMEKIGY